MPFLLHLLQMSYLPLLRRHKKPSSLIHHHLIKKSSNLHCRGNSPSEPEKIPKEDSTDLTR
ncbi:MAG: hypothetical protein D3919_15255 [Candidatus Electrothrix sp. AW5]|nr:hypothetical protein [Candidatus Electrothrix gigas]